MDICRILTQEIWQRAHTFGHQWLFQVGLRMMKCAKVIELVYFLVVFHNLFLVILKRIERVEERKHSFSK